VRARDNFVGRQKLLMAYDVPAPHCPTPGLARQMDDGGAGGR